MAMTHEQFEALVGRLEEKARSNPAAYRMQVIALACVGYGYLALVFGFLFFLFLVTLASVLYLKALAVKIAAPLGAFLWFSVKALWVKLEPPQGHRLRRADAPALFALIDELRRALRSARFHRVLVTDQFNAGVTQIPRLGIFGLHRNYLIIGLPLMTSVTPEQFKAVLAHEFGHLAGGHGRFSNWIYRLRVSWARLLGALEARKSWGSFLFKPFFERYAPYFNAYSFPLARAQEYEADRAAARLTSPRALAESLTALDVIGTYLGERYWPGIHRKADEVPQPSFAPYSGMGKGMASDVQDATAREWVDRAMTVKTGVDDTHPALPDRLKAIGQAPRVWLPVPGRGADILLGKALPAIIEELDRRWRESIQPSWEKRYREVQESRARLAELDKRAAGGEAMSLDQSYERAKLTEDFGAGPDAALEQFRALSSRWPEEPGAWIALGRRLLARDDESGFSMVERAMQKDEEFILAACEALRDYCWRKGRKDEAHAWHARLVERTRILEAAREERSVVNVSDKFDRHDLADAALADLRRQLATVQGLKKAYLVRKQVRHFPQRPCYVLGHVARGFWNRKQRSAQVQRQIVEKVVFPAETLVMSVEGVNYRFGRKLRFMRGSRIV